MSDYGYLIQKDNYGKSSNVDKYKKIVENMRSEEPKEITQTEVQKGIEQLNSPIGILSTVRRTTETKLPEIISEKKAEREEQERWDNLSIGQKIVDPFKTMGANIKYGDLGIKENQAWSEYRSKQDAETLAKAQEATKAREEYEVSNNRIGKGNAFTKDFAQYLPQLGGQLASGLGGAAAGAGAGAAGGAGVALAAGQLGPQVALPEEIATVPAGALTGAIWGGKGGYVAGTAKYSYDVMAGNAYKTLLDMGVPNDVALELSGDEAIINSLIEGTGAVVDLISLGIGKLGTKGATTATKKIAQSRLLAAAKAYGLNLATEPLEEMAQEKVSIETEKKAADVSGIERQATEAQDRERIKESGLGALKVSAIAGLGNAGGNVITNKINDNITAKAEQKQLDQDVKDLQQEYQTQQAMNAYKKLSPYSKYQPAEVNTNISTKDIKQRPALPEGGKIYVDENGVAVDSRNYVAPSENNVQNNNYSPINSRQVLVNPQNQLKGLGNLIPQKNVAQESPTNDFQEQGKQTILPTQKIQETVNSAKIVGMSDFDVKKATEIHKMLQSGSNLKFYDSKNVPAGVDSRAINANGFYKDGTLWINKDSKRQVEKILGHELTHHLENTEEYSNFAKSIFDSNLFYDYITSQGYDNVEQFKENLRQRGYSDKDMDYEMVSMFAEDNLFDSQEKIDRLARENRTLAQKILNWLSDMKTKLVGTSQEKELLRIENMYRKALEQARGNEQIDTKVAGNEPAFSLSETDIKNYLEENSMELRANGSLVANNLTDKQIKDLVKIYKANGYEDVSTDYLVGALQRGSAFIPREVADVFIEKQLGYKPQYDTTKIYEDAEGNKLTKEQVEFYKDSAVRDIRGRLIPVYHRTDSEFYTFDKNASARHGKKYGQGFYFSITPENYGNREMKVYLNAKEGEFKYVPKQGYYIVQEPNQIKDVTNTKPTSNSDIRFSLNDSEGRTLSKEQQEFFKDSKARDEDGNLQVVYHGTEKGGFTVFEETKDVGYFFTDDFTMARTYSGVKDINKSIKFDNWQQAIETVEEYGMSLTENDDGNYVFDDKFSDDVIYEADELKVFMDDFMRNYVQEESTNYEVYLNMKDPLIIDGNGSNWEEVYDYQEGMVTWDELTEEEQEAFIEEFGEGIETDGETQSGEQLPIYNPTDMTVSYPKNTRAWAEEAKDMGFDGVIIKDIYDGGKYSYGGEAGNVYIVFDSNQIKNVDNQNPTSDSDIRYSIDTKEDNTSNARALSRYAQTLQKKHKDIPEHVNLIQKEIDNGNFMHEVIRDKRSLNYAENYIKDNGFEDAVKHWDELMKRGKTVDKDELALGQTIYNLAVENKDTRLVMKMASDLVQEYTEIGRNLQSATLLRKMTPDGRLYALERSVQKINQDLMQKFDDFENIQIPEELADKLLNSETQKEMDVAVENIQEYIASQIPATWQEKLNSWRYLSMLGNPRTHIRNIVGNAVFVPAVEIKNKLAQAGELLIPKDQRTKATLTKKDSKLLKYAENDFDNNQETIRGESKYDIKAGIQEKRQIYSTKALEFARKGNFNLLEQEDKLFLKFRYKRAFAGALKARGITIEQLRENSPETVRKVNEIRSYAINEAQKATYRDASIVASMISRGKRKLLNAANQSSGAAKLGYNLAYLGVEGVVPFTKTPINIIKRGIEYSPAGLLNGIKDAAFNVKNGKVTAAQAIDKIAAGATGTAIVGLGYLLASLGLVSGGEEEKDKEQALKELKGYQDYALNVFGKSYTIDWTAPSSIPLFIGVEIYNSIKSGDESAWLKALSNVAEPVVEMSMLQGLNSTLTTMGEDNALGNIIGKTLTNYLGQYNPTLLGQIARSIDKKRRTTYVDKNIPVPAAVQRFIQQQVAKIPGASMLLPTYKDQFGQEQITDNVIDRVVQNFLSPGYVKDIKEGVVEKGLTELYEKTGETSVIPSYAAKTLTQDKEKINLTAKEYDTYAKTRGELSMKGLEGVFKDKTYQNLTDKQKVDVVKGIYDYANDVAKTKVLKGFELEGNNKKAQELDNKGLDFYKFVMIKKTADTDGNGYTSDKELDKAISKYGATRWKGLIKKKEK